MSTKNTNKLNRFTTLPFLIDLLRTKKLILLNPKSWEDHNDTDILLDYKEKNSIKSLLALCFTDESETIHHWKTFSNGESGCCIEFNKTELLSLLEKDKRIDHRKVNYPLIEKADKVATEDIPFTKRRPYECENEYRVIMKIDDLDVMFFPINIPLNCITKVTLSPRLPASAFNSIREVLLTLIGNEKLEINPSTIFKNEEWINGFKKRSTI